MRRALLSALLLGGLCSPTLVAAQSTPSPPEDLSGTWVLTRRLTAVSNVAMVGRIRSESELVAIYTLTETGGRLQGPGVACALEIDTGTALARTIVPDAYVAHYPISDMDAAVTRTEAGVALTAERSWVILGADLADPQHDPLPTEPDDPRVADTDQDGFPGVTLEMQGTLNGFIRSAQRTWFDLRGVLDGERFVGTVAWDQERVVLDATRRGLRRETDTAPDDDASRNTFVLERVAPGTTCGDL